MRHAGLKGLNKSAQGRVNPSETRIGAALGTESTMIVTPLQGNGFLFPYPRAARELVLLVLPWAILFKAFQASTINSYIESPTAIPT